MWWTVFRFNLSQRDRVGLFFSSSWIQSFTEDTIIISHILQGRCILHTHWGNWMNFQNIFLHIWASSLHGVNSVVNHPGLDPLILLISLLLLSPPLWKMPTPSFSWHNLQFKMFLTKTFLIGLHLHFCSVDCFKLPQLLLKPIIGLHTKPTIDVTFN